MTDLQELANTFENDGFVLLDQLWSPDETAEVESELERFMVECVPQMERVHKTFTDGWQGMVPGSYR